MDAAVIQLFSPRRDQWEDHFVLVGSRILGKTSEGRTMAWLYWFKKTGAVQPERPEHRFPIGLGGGPADR